MMIFVLTLAVFGIAMLIMAVGVMLQGRCLRGSCGGPDIVAPDGTPLTCASCPKRKQLEEERLAALGSGS